MKDKVVKLTDREMSAIQNQRNKTVLLTTQAEKAIAEAKVSDLEYQNLVQRIYLENGLDAKCKVEEDGSVVWPEEAKEAKPEEAKSEVIEGEKVA